MTKQNKNILKYYGLIPISFNPKKLKQAQLDLEKVSYNAAKEDRLEHIRAWNNMKDWTFI